MKQKEHKIIPIVQTDEQDKSLDKLLSMVDLSVAP